MPEEEVIKKLEEYKANVMQYLSARSPDMRSNLIRKRALVQSLVAQAGCMKSITLAPPPAVGGLVHRNVDPFDYMFDELYGAIVSKRVIDILDESIGKIEAGALSRNPRNVPELDVPIRKGYAFVVMAINPADQQLVDVLDAIKEAASSRDIFAERVDDQQDNSRITDRIIDSINRAEYVICDLTHSRPNVYYEAGYASGKGKTPIFIARKGADIHFDVKDFPVIFFENIRQLKEGLRARLEAISKQNELK